MRATVQQQQQSRTTHSSSATSSIPDSLYCLERLSVEDSVPAAARFVLDCAVKDRYIVGRDTGSVDLHVDSARQPGMISRRHAILQWAGSASGGGWRVIDLRSVNGLFVNWVKASEAALCEGDVLCLGGGCGVKEGARREQPSSEFRFLFRSLPRERPVSPPLPPVEWSDHSSMPTPEAESSLTSPTGRRAAQRSISLPFAAHPTATALNITQHPATAELNSPNTAPQRKRRRAAADEQADNDEDEASTAAAHRVRMEKLQEEKREMQEQYLMTLAELEKRESDRREAEERYRNEQRRNQQEIREERQRVATLEQEKAEKEARESEERQQMERAMQALEAAREHTDATSAEEKRRIQAELDGMRQRMEQMKQESESERTSAERMKEEFVCQFCLFALVAPLTLACSHSFCSQCLADWWQAGNDSCISCRQPVVLPPIRALSLENAIAHLLQGDELDEWKQRRQEWADAQRGEQRRHQALVEHIEQQRRTNPVALAFMNVGAAWSEEEKALFKSGFAPYQKSEECRRAYCALVGLTEEWTQRAGGSELKRAANNLRLREGLDPTSAVVSSSNKSELEKAALQRRFWLLLKLGCKVDK